VIDLSRFAMIANPISGRRKSVDMAQAAYQRLVENQKKGELYLTQKRGDAYRLAGSAINQGVRFLIGCGGDGTIHEIINAIGQTETDLALGILPCGKGNDLARALNIPTNLELATEILLTGRPKKIDLGKVGSHYFSTIVTCGYDAEVGRRVTEEGIQGIAAIFSGTLAYVVTAITTLPLFKAPMATIQGDFGTYQGQILISSTGVTGSYGGGMRILPDAVMDDGLFDVCIIQPISHLTILRMLVTLFWGGHTKHPAVQIHRTKSLSITTDPPMKMYADGEYIGDTPKQIQILPRKLTVVAP